MIAFSYNQLQSIIKRLDNMKRLLIIPLLASSAAYADVSPWSIYGGVGEGGVGTKLEAGDLSFSNGSKNGGDKIDSTSYSLGLKYTINRGLAVRIEGYSTKSGESPLINNDADEAIVFTDAKFDGVMFVLEPRIPIGERFAIVFGIGAGQFTGSSSVIVNSDGERTEYSNEKDVKPRLIPYAEIGLEFKITRNLYVNAKATVLDNLPNVKEEAEFSWENRREQNNFALSIGWNF